MAEPLFNRLCLVGVGLIGSSIARVAKKRGDIAKTLVVTTRRAETLERVRELGLADVVEADAARAVEGCDGVIFCIPVGAYADAMRHIAPHLAPGAVLTDVGSTKGSVVRDLAPLMPEGVHLIPAHPMAGTEHSGPDAGFPELFEGRYCIVTPLPDSDPAAALAAGREISRVGAATAE